MVVLAHAPTLGGFGSAPHLGSLSMQTLAVDGFFVLSGFLIIDSFRRASSTWRFLSHRALRIFPGYWMCLLVIAVVVGPIGTLLEGRPLSDYPVASFGPLSYVIDNFLLSQGQWPLAGLFANNPYPWAVNGSLWTLMYEAGCYMTVAAVGACGLLRSRRPAVLTAAALVLAGLLAARPQSQWSRLGLAFAPGGLVLVNSDRIPLSTGHALRSRGMARSLGARANHYVVLRRSARLPPLVRGGATSDPSWIAARPLLRRVHLRLPGAAVAGLHRCSSGRPNHLHRRNIAHPLACRVALVPLRRTAGAALTWHVP